MWRLGEGSRPSEDGSSHTTLLEDLDVSDAIFSVPGLTMFCRLDGFGLEVAGQHVSPGRVVLECRIVDADDWCRNCGGRGLVRDMVTRDLAHEPFGWRSTVLRVWLRRYHCVECGHLWRQDMSRAAQPRAWLSRRGVRWALEAVVCQHLTVARAAEELGVAWETSNDAIIAEGKRVLIDDPARFDGVTVLGVDEHCWPHPRR